MPQRSRCLTQITVPLSTMSPTEASSADQSGPIIGEDPEASDYFALFDTKCMRTHGRPRILIGPRRAGVYSGLKVMGEGAVLAGMVLGSIVAFLLMRRFYASATAAAVGAVLSFVGLIHAAEVAWAAAPQIALGYALLAVVLVAFAFLRRHADDEADALAAEASAETATH